MRKDVEGILGYMGSTQTSLQGHLLTNAQLGCFALNFHLRPSKENFLLSYLFCLRRPPLSMESLIDSHTDAYGCYTTGKESDSLHKPVLQTYPVIFKSTVFIRQRKVRNFTYVLLEQITKWLCNHLFSRKLVSVTNCCGPTPVLNKGTFWNLLFS